jgi:hypothetical protein
MDHARSLDERVRQAADDNQAKTALKAFNTKATAILKSIVTTEIDAPGSTVYFTNSALHQLKSLNN